jgi:hypothetical protein
MQRRRFLLGAASTTLALPMLEYFQPRAAHAHGVKPRLLVYYFPNGRRPEWWAPVASGDTLVFPQQAVALQPFADNALSFVNLTNTAAIGSPGAAHAMGTGTIMTCKRISTVAGGVVENDISLDQALVKALEPDTRFQSLQWSAGEPGPCDVGGSSCAYTQSISWTGVAKPLVPTIDPRAAFERVFGRGVDGLDGPAADLRRASLVSVLDYVKDDARTLQNQLGHSDQMRLEEYFDSLRELERGLSYESGECLAEQNPPVPGLGYEERVAAFHQLIKLAFQCDQTRVISFMIEFGLSGRSHEFLGAPGGHHAISHYGNQTDRDRLMLVEEWQVKQLGAMLGLLRDTPALTGGTLLDETLVLGIGSMGEGNGHDHARNCPILFGGTGTVLTDGRQIAFPSEAPHPLANLHVTLLDAFGVDASFGQAGNRFGDDGTAAIPGVIA